MDQTIISLIGVASTLQHILETDPAANNNRDMRAACKRLESIRRELLAEGLRHSKIVGAARDSIFDLSAQLQGHLTGRRDMQWVLHGLQSFKGGNGNPPPPPPSSSSSGPHQLSPEILQLARQLVEITSAQPELETRPAGNVRVAVAGPVNGHSARSVRSTARNQRA